VTVPATKNLSAHINLMPGRDPKLIVVGDVMTDSANKVPQLRQSRSQGVLAQDLFLEMLIENNGLPGTQDQQFRPFRYERPASQGQYLAVTIFYESEKLASLLVEEVH